MELASGGVAGGIGSAFGAAKLRDEYKRDYPKSFTAGMKRAVHTARDRGVPPHTVARAVRVAHSGHPGFVPLATVVGASAVATGAHRYGEISHWARRRQAELQKAAPRRASSSAIEQLRVPVHQPKHAAKPYVGRRRVATRLDAARAHASTVVMTHGPRLYKVADGVVDMLKADTGQELGRLPKMVHMRGVGRCRVIGYHGNNHFRVVDPTDSERLVHRDQVTIVRPSKKETGMSKSAFGVDHSIEKSVGTTAGRAARKLTDGVQSRTGAALAGAGAGAAAGPVLRRVKNGSSDEVGKSAFGQRGDKRNTKYAGAAYAGGVGGAVAGRTIGARSAGVSARDVSRLSREAGTMHASGMASRAMSAGERTGGGPLRQGVAIGRSINHEAKGLVRNLPGGSRYMKGNKVGLAVGAAGGAAAYAAHRHRQGVAKSAFGVEHYVGDELHKADQKKPSAGRVATGTYFGPYHSAVAGKKGRKLNAVGTTVGHGIAGNVAGGALGALTRRPGGAVGGAILGTYAGSARAVYRNQAKGNYKKES